MQHSLLAPLRLGGLHGSPIQAVVVKTNADEMTPDVLLVVALLVGIPAVSSQILRAGPDRNQWHAAGYFGPGALDEGVVPWFRFNLFERPRGSVATQACSISD